MTTPHPRTSIEDIETARRTIAGFAAEMPALAPFWRNLDTALADTAALAVEVTRLRSELAAVRLDAANLLAAARAALAAHADGESDPLYYLRDELESRQMPSEPHGRAS